MSSRSHLIANAAPARARHFSISSNWLQIDDCRFDATIYAEEGFEALRILESSKFELVPLAALVGRVYHPTESQPRSNFKRVWVKRGEGPAFLTGKQLFFFRPDSDKFVSQRMHKLHELLVPQGTILLSRSGTTGYPVMVGKWLSQFAVTDDAIRIFAGTEPVGFIYAFLASSIGRPLLVKHEYGSTVSHLEAKHVKTAPVPLVPQELRKEIHASIMRAYQLRDESNQLLDQADSRLHQYLGVSTFSEHDIEYLGEGGKPKAFGISSSDLNDRLDATHHVPVVRSVLHKLQQGRFGLVRLSEHADVYLPPRFGRVYVERNYGTPFLQGSQLPAMYPLQLQYISQSQTSEIKRWLIKKDTILITRSGTIGRVALVTEKQNGWAASEHMIRITCKPGRMHPGFLTAFLSTPFGQHQLKAKIYGGVVDELTDFDTAILMVPDIPASGREAGAQVGIGILVSRAFEMRDEANMIEKAAIDELEARVKRGI